MTPPQPLSCEPSAISTGGDGFLSGVVERYLPESAKPSWRITSNLVDDILATVDRCLTGKDSDAEGFKKAIGVFR